jgi:RNA-directed DNA polymerase
VIRPASQDKPYVISKQAVWDAYRRVRANKGAPGVDGRSVEEFESDLKNNLYKIWNRMSSGTYFPPPVRSVEIPKPHGDGVRVLGVPTVADRIAQTVVAMELETVAERKFHPDSRTPDMAGRWLRHFPVAPGFLGVSVGWFIVCP